MPRIKYSKLPAAPATLAASRGHESALTERMAGPLPLPDTVASTLPKSADKEIQATEKSEPKVPASPAVSSPPCSNGLLPCHRSHYNILAFPNPKLEWPSIREEVPASQGSRRAPALLLPGPAGPCRARGKWLSSGESPRHYNHGYLASATSDFSPDLEMPHLPTAAADDPSSIARHPTGMGAASMETGGSPTAPTGSPP